MLLLLDLQRDSEKKDNIKTILNKLAVQAVLLSYSGP